MLCEYTFQLQHVGFNLACFADRSVCLLRSFNCNADSNVLILNYFNCQYFRDHKRSTTYLQCY